MVVIRTEETDEAVAGYATSNAWLQCANDRCLTMALWSIPYGGIIRTVRPE